jgi:hypothetical protein
MTKGTIDKLATLHPILACKAKAHIESCNNALNGVYEVICTDGWRSKEDQEKALKSGNSKAKWGYSYHNYGLAYDLAPMGLSDKRIFWEDDRAWDAIGNCSKGLGLEWGGKWKTFIDRPHFQLSIAPIKEIRMKWNELEKINGSWGKVYFFDWVTELYLAQ